MPSRKKADAEEPKWPADAPVRRPTSALIPYARNSRTHSETQVAQIAASIREWGFTNPVLIDEKDGIIAGHGRVLAAQVLGLETVPCLVCSGWTEAYRKSFYSVMFAPSCVRIGTLRDPRSEGGMRIHHDINWHHVAPRIVREVHRKPRAAEPD